MLLLSMFNTCIHRYALVKLPMIHVDQTFSPGLSITSLDIFHKNDNRQQIIQDFVVHSGKLSRHFMINLGKRVLVVVRVLLVQSRRKKFTLDNHVVHNNISQYHLTHLLLRPHYHRIDYLWRTFLQFYGAPAGLLGAPQSRRHNFFLWRTWLGAPQNSHISVAHLAWCATEFSHFCGAQNS